MSPTQAPIEPDFKASPAEQPGHLCRIPLDIRELIYGHLLPSNSILYPKVGYIFARVKEREINKRKDLTHERVLGLARTCQTFYMELIPFYYRTKAVSFGSAYDLYRYVNMIGPYRRQLVQKVDFWLRAGVHISDRATRRDDVWACEMLRQCCSLRKLGVGVSKMTKYRMEEGPLRGLDALRGMWLKGLEVRVRDVRRCVPWEWSGLDVVDPGGKNFWDIPLIRPEGERYFEPEVVSALEKRLLEDMQAGDAGNGKEAKVEDEDAAGLEVKALDSGPASIEKGRDKREASGTTTNERSRRFKMGNARNG